jgi:TRAP-type C4-dicarboxylate transport system substrate-binding protein
MFSGTAGLGMMRFLLSIVVLFGPSLAYAQALDPITLTIATWGTQSHPHEKEFVRPFIDAATRKSGGRLKFKYFPNGSMVKQDDVATSVPGGLVDIALTIIDSWAGRDHNVSVTATPLWTLSMAEAETKLVPGQPLFDYFASDLEKSRVKLLCLFDIGPPIIASRFPLAAPEDLDGKVVRALSMGTAEDLQALKASPIVMGVGQVYPALQRRTVDGAMNGIQGSVGLRYYEVAEYEMATGGALGTIISGYVMNLKSFRALPSDLQQVIVEAAAETRVHTQRALIETYPLFLKQAASHGVKIYTLEKGTPMWGRWQSAMTPYKDKLRSLYSTELVNLLQQENRRTQ